MAALFVRFIALGVYKQRSAALPNGALLLSTKECVIHWLTLLVFPAFVDVLD